MRNRERTGRKIGQFAGAGIFVHRSLIFATLILIALFAPRFAALDTGAGYLTALAFVVGLYISILVHEFAHLLVARGFGMTVESVDLHMMGGQTNIRGTSKTPWQEFALAACGPLTSAGIGFGLIALAPAMRGTPGAVVLLVGQLNIILAVFNALPSPPLDGGRMAAAIGWFLTKSQRRGLEIASVTGRVTAALIAVLGVWVLAQATTVYFSQGVILLLVASYLWTATKVHTAQAIRRLRVEMLTVAGLVQPHTAPTGAVRLHIGLSGTALLTAMAENPADVYAVVDDNGTPVGSMHTADVDRVWKESR